MVASQEPFAPKVTVLIEGVRHHVKEEEQGLFPVVRKASRRSDLVDLVPALEAACTVAPSRAMPTAPDTPSELPLLPLGRLWRATRCSGRLSACTT